MGFTPRQVDEMTLWEFTACAEGYNAAHSPTEQTRTPPSDEDHKRLMEKHKNGCRN